MKSNSILVCGIPESGKTTFLAALWYLIFNQEIKTFLQLGTVIPEDREYLNRISNLWVRGKPLHRTTTSEFHEIKLQLKDQNNTLELIVPDISGETWEGIWQNRSCSQVAADWAIKSDSIALFIHANKIRAPVSLDSFRNVTLENTTEIDSEVGNSTKAQEIPWTPESTPTQVILVEILQSLAIPPLSGKKKKLIIFLSAWDKVEEFGLDPDSFLKTYFPLLDQFLNFSNLYLEVKIVGISAIGGDLESPEQVSSLLEIDHQSERIKVVEGDVIHHDLTLPIGWLMAE